MIRPRKILYGAGGVILLAVILGVFLPSQLRVERHISIDAPPATVFALISDVRRLQQWLPWIERQQGMETLAEGPPRGSGAGIRWTTPSGAKGRLTVIDSVAFSGVAMRLDMAGAPSADLMFELRPSEDATEVKLSYRTDVGLDLLLRYLRPVQASRVSSASERGLAALEAMAESLPRADFGALDIVHMTVESRPIAYVTTSSPPTASAISEAMGRAFFEVLRFIDRQGLTEAGAPLSISRTFSGSRLVFEAAVPIEGVTETTSESAGGVRIGQSYGGPVVRVSHVGSYASLTQTHERIAAYLAAYGIERNGDPWESYESDPARTTESALLTYVWYPVTEMPREPQRPGGAEGISRT